MDYTTGKHHTTIKGMLWITIKQVNNITLCSMNAVYTTYLWLCDVALKVSIQGLMPSTCFYPHLALDPAIYCNIKTFNCVTAEILVYIKLTHVEPVYNQLNI